VWQWSFNGTPAQKWRVEHSHGIYTFIPMHSQNMRLDIRGGVDANGTRMQVWENANHNNQRFRIIQNAQGHRRIMPLSASSRAMEVQNGVRTERGIIQVWQYQGLAHMHWCDQLQGASVKPYISMFYSHAQCLQT